MRSPVAHLLMVYVLPAAAAVAVTLVYARAAVPDQRICQGSYALCSGARCVPLADDPTKAVCFCDVHDGPNLSAKPCDQVKATTSTDGTRIVYSTYSLANYAAGKKGMTCPAGTLHTGCMGVACTVDPTDPSRALCICPVQQSDTPWITMGGGCNTDDCKTGFWTAASAEILAKSNALMLKATGADPAIVKMCP